MRAIVIGAGLAGLSAAYGLHRAGVEVLVAEQAPPDRPEGSGLSLLANGLTALEALGLGDHVRELTRGDAPTGGGQRRPDGTWFYRLPGTALSAVRVVHRAELRTVLMGALPPGTVRSRTSAHVDDVRAGRVHLLNPNGTRSDVQGDVVVCADGIRSQARAAMGLPAGVRYAGYGAWRGVTARPMKNIEPSETWGRGLRFGLVPLADGRVYWFAVRSGPRMVCGDHRELVLATFGDWHDPVRRVVQATPADTVSWSPIDELAGRLPSFVAGRCVLLGDAAHAMTPNLGQGGNQGLEDAATLVRLLARLQGARGHPAAGDVLPALASYDALRRPRSQSFARRSRLVGVVGQVHGPATTRIRDAMLGAVPAFTVNRSVRQLQAWRPPP